MHRLLKRQLKKHLNDENVSPDLKKLLEDIDASYQNFDDDYKRLERILELSSQELFKTNKLLNNEKDKIKEELRISEERWRYALSGGQDGIWDWNIETNELYVSESWKEMLGYTDPEDHPKFPEAWQLVHPDDLEKAQSKFEAYTKGEIKTYHNEYRLRCKNGEYKHILDRGRIIESKDLTGKVIRKFIGTHTDISRLKEAEEKAQMAQLIVKNSPTILIRWTPNFRLNIEYISENISNYGYNSQDWIKQQVPFTQYVHPADVKPVTRKVLKSFREKTARVQIRFRLRTTEGEYRWIDSDNKIVWEGKEEKAAFFQGVLTDITEQIEAEEKLKKSETRFRSLVQNSTDITTILDKDANTVYESPSFYRTFGFEEKDVIGKNIFEFIHPDDIGIAQKEFFKGIERGGISDPIEFRLRHRNGSWLYVESVGNNLLHEPGIEGIVINSRDITDRKEAEEQSKRLRKFYEIILNKIPTDVVVFDDKHRYLFANEMAIKDPEKRAFIIGKDDYDYCEHYGKDIAMAHNRRAIFNKVAYQKEQLEFEEPLQTSKGTIWVLRRMFPLIDETGKLTNVIGFGFDITERKLAEQKILKSQNELEEAQHIARIGSWEIDMRTDTVTWSKEMRIIHEVDNKFTPTLENVHLFYTPETRDEIVDAFQKAIHNKKAFDIESQIVTEKGHTLDVRTKAIPVIQEGRVPYVRGVFQDITQQKEAQRKLREYNEELESINKELDQFAYIVSHDLKAPLRAINNLSMWIEEDLEGKLEGDTQHQFNLLRGRVSRLEDLINGILNYSRAGRISGNPVQVNVESLLNGILEMLSPPKEFKITVADKLPTLNTEKIALEQVFSNLISNAVKYNKSENPTIAITCENEGDFYKFGVNDNGDGIDPQFHEKIFVIFQTLEARDKVESTGVGLAIVKKIIDDKGGKVWVASEKGKGTTFYFTWPKA